MTQSLDKQSSTKPIIEGSHRVSGAARSKNSERGVQPEAAAVIYHHCSETCHAKRVHTCHPSVELQSPEDPRLCEDRLCEGGHPCKALIQDQTFNSTQLPRVMTTTPAVIFLGG